MQVFRLVIKKNIILLYMSAPVTVNEPRLPDATTLQRACKLAISENKPICMDYWTSSVNKTALIGVKENGEKLLVKSEDEYTSPISKIFKISNECIVLTENNIYLVDINIPTKKISALELEHQN